MCDHLSEFLEAKRAEGLSASTVAWYEFQVGRFCQWLGDRGMSLRVARSYLAEMADDGLSSSMRRGAAIAIKAFSRWLAEEGLGEDFAGRLKLPKKGKPLPREARLSDVASVFAIASPRDRALLLFMLDTGARRAEVAGLRWVDVDLDGLHVRLTGKGSKERLVAMTSRTAELLRAIRPDSVSADDHVFVGQRGPLTVSGISSVLRRLKAKAGVVGPLNPHSLRHAFGSNFVANGGDLESLRQILGHEDISTTRIYLDLARETVEEKHRRYSPVNGLELDN